ncbi:unnamed protein product, partial [Nesidiocoris tenuis]
DLLASNDEVTDDSNFRHNGNLKNWTILTLGRMLSFDDVSNTDWNFVASSVT